MWAVVIRLGQDLTLQATEQATRPTDGADASPPLWGENCAPLPRSDAGFVCVGILADAPPRLVAYIIVRTPEWCQSD